MKRSLVTKISSLIRRQTTVRSTKANSSTGFTLIELMVAVTVFSVVMLICMGSIIAVFDANKKSQSLRAVMDNLNSALEGMTRTIRFGDTYHCGGGIQVGILTALDCPVGDSSISLNSTIGQITYRLENGLIKRNITGVGELPITSPDITITSLVFRVYGSPPYSGGSDLFQPQVIVVVSGFSGSKPTVKSTFTLETTLSQRKLDFQ